MLCKWFVEINSRRWGQHTGEVKIYVM